MYYDMIMTGFGGQGIQMISQLVAVASIRKGLNITYLPSYGVEKRGGRTNVTVVVSDEDIGSPITNMPCALIAMDRIGLDFYQPVLKSAGVLIYNSNLIPPDAIERNDIDIVKVNCNDEAVAIGNAKLANMVTLGTLIGRIDFLKYEDIENIIEEVIPEHHRKTIPDNLKAVKRGMEISKNN